MASPSGFAIFFLVLFVVGHASVAPFVHGRRDVQRESKYAAKTIEAEGGDVIDCVDIEKQPALDHPRLKGHKIQMEPSLLPERIKTTDDRSRQGKIELKRVNCPRGTVPILRTNITTPPVNMRGYGFGFRSPLVEDAYATIMGERGDYRGISGWLNVWNPLVEVPDEASGGYIWVQTGLSGDKNLNLAGVGWTVNPTVFGDNYTRFAILWTRDNFIKTGCFNHHCPGFVQVSRDQYLGGKIVPLSEYGDDMQQFHLPLRISQDNMTKNWWLFFHDKPFGYWPRSIFTELSAGAESLSWGGKVLRSRSRREWNATTPEMGSGHLPEEGFSRACYVFHVGLVNRSFDESEPSKLLMVASRDRYDTRVEAWEGTRGVSLYFGGSGRRTLEDLV